MSRALVLNATYEPLAVVSSRRAVVLVIEDKAELVHASEEAWHSERAVVEVPSVIRLRYYVKVPYKRRAALTRRAVFLRDGSGCQYCGRKADNIDHVVPRSRGGQHVWENVVASCAGCNARKRDRFLEETTMRLRRRPQAPHHLSWVVVAVGHVPAHWAPYLSPGREAAEMAAAGA